MAGTGLESSELLSPPSFSARPPPARAGAGLEGRKLCLIDAEEPTYSVPEAPATTIRGETSMPHHQSSGINSGQFLPGQPRPVGSGRQKGTPNKRTTLIHSGLKSAMETLREGNGENPVQAAVRIARTLEGMTAKRREKFEDETSNLPPAEFDRLVAAMKIA